nr:PEP/pyruvate-binding domain-containing protein [Parachlamydia sp. AcF125]
MCHLLSIPEIQVCVPPFICFAHAEIFAHIDQYYPEYLEDWAIFTQIQTEEASFSPDAQLCLWKIQENLIHVFTNYPFHSAALEEFLTHKVEKDQVLVVRSTGREDGETFSNAGGNRSESGILPDIAAISVGIGKVIASYHSVKSLRLRALGEDDPYSTPFLAVFIQVMIGEIYESSCRLGIPVSGILHTQEVLGYTPQLIQLQALYGHNEALVKNIQPFDTFYVYPDDIHSIIPFKKKRMVASLAGEFVTIDNPWELRTSATLSPSLLFIFYHLAEKIQSFFQKTMEVEWVYSNQTLFLVQARPLISSKKLSPTFVNEQRLREHVQDFSVYQGETIASKGGVTLLTRANELIQDATLEKGFNHYLQDSKSTAKAIFARISAATTSHAACSLREQGIEVLCGIDILSEQLDRSDCFALLDSQQGKLFIASCPGPAKDTLWEWLKEKGIIEEGWTSHPIPAIESIPEREEVPFENLNLPSLTNKELRELFKAAHQQLEEGGVKKLVGSLAAEMQNMEDKPLLKQRLKKLFNHAFHLWQGYFVREASRKQKLHALKRLEALFFQKRSVDILETDSRKEILEEQYLVFQMEKYAVVAEVKKAWRAFIEPLFQDMEALKKLESLIYEIQENKISEEWINIAFSHAWKEKQAESSKELLNHLEVQFKNSLSSLSQISTARQNWHIFREKLTLWGEPEQFELLWRDLKTSLLPELHDMTHQFFSLPANQWLIRVVLLKFLQETVEIYDRAIKELKSSSIYSTQDKALQVSRFKEMLLSLFDLMQIWVMHIPSANIQAWIRTIEGFGDKLPGDYREIIIQAIQRAFNHIHTYGEEQLLPSVDFNVNALVISSAYFKNQELPSHSTLEDLCTLMHQNILVAQMAACVPLWEGKLPSAIYLLHNSLLSIKQDCFVREGVQVPVHANWVGVSYLYPCFSLKYNIPVKNHSTIIDVGYHLVDKKVQVEVRMIGHNRGGRMDKIGKDVCIQSLAQNLKFVIYPEYDTHLKMLFFWWSFTPEEVRSEKKLKFITQLLIKALEDTLVERDKLASLKLESVDNGNVYVWKALWASKENTLAWFKAGAPYFQALMQRCFSQKWNKECQTILSYLGMHFKKNGADLFTKVFFALVDFLQTHPRYFCAYGSDSQFFGLDEFSDWALDDILNHPKASELLVSHREKLLYHLEDPAETKIFYLALHLAILKNLLKKQDHEGAAQFVKFLIANQQDGTVVDLSIHGKSLSLSPAIERVLQQGAQGKIVDGYPVATEVALQSTPVVDMHEIKKESRILVKFPNTAQWIAATVIKSSPPETLAEPFGSLKIRLSRGRVQKLIHPSGIRLLPLMEY